MNGLVTIELEGIVTVHCDENQSPEIEGSDDLSCRDHNLDCVKLQAARTPSIVKGNKSLRIKSFGLV